MHISKLSLVNYRNFANAQLEFAEGVNTIVGENGSGKSNVFRAIRLLLDDHLLRSAYRLGESDFHRGLGSWRGHWIIISLEFEDISADEAVQALFIHGFGEMEEDTVDRAAYNLLFRPTRAIRQRLAGISNGDHAALQRVLADISIDDYETVFTGRSEADFNDPDLYLTVVGDFENAVFPGELDFPEIGARVPNGLSISREVSFTYIQALRDVVSDFQNNKVNPLRTLLKSRSGDIDPTAFSSITEKVRELNESIESWPEVKSIGSDIKDTISATVGEAYSPTSMSIKSELSDDADRLLQSLKLFVGEGGETYEGAIHELSLGGANLIYLTLKLLEFQYQSKQQTIANFLLIEEPEAHIHTHIQKTLFDKLAYTDTQVLYTTHSPQISEVSNVRRMNILGRDRQSYVAYQPSNGLEEARIRSVERYLDTVRSNLLFARSVLLVEGDAEEIMIPAMVKQIAGVSLDELGISLINIRSTGFENVAALFHDHRIQKRCGILTDLDAAFVDLSEVEGESQANLKFKARAARSQKSGLERKGLLDAFVDGNQWLEVFRSPHTFEVDLAAAGNSSMYVGLLGEIYTDASTIDKAKSELESGDIAVFGKRALTLAKAQGKGWFALKLADQLDPQTKIPEHILRALAFVQPNLTVEVWANIFGYRLRLMRNQAKFSDEILNEFGEQLDSYRQGTIDLQEIKEQFLTAFAADRINDLLNVY